jgi:hypothetical protein
VKIIACIEDKLTIRKIKQLPKRSSTQALRRPGTRSIHGQLRRTICSNFALRGANGGMNTTFEVECNASCRWPSKFRVILAAAWARRRHTYATWAETLG